MRTTIGHEPVRRRFERTLSAGRLASTYLLVGPEGVGKRTFAHELAARLLCVAPPRAGSLAACGRCDPCRQAMAGQAPDLITVGLPAGRASLPLEAFIGRREHRHREGLCHDLAVKPMLSPRRVAIIDDADALNLESANALLKTLEEPPPRSVIFLIGTGLARQLPTIRSRSQVVRFGPLTDAQVERVLREHGLLPDGADPAGAAALGRGSVAHALAAAADAGDAARALGEQVFGGREPPDPLRLAQAVMEHAQTGAQEPAARRERLRAVLGLAVEHYRDRLKISVGADASATERWLAALDHTLAAEEALDRNANQATLVQAWARNVTGLA